MTLVWSSSPGCSNRDAMSAPGSSSAPLQGQCYPKTTQLGVRCCADVFFEACRSNECSSREHPGNTCQSESDGSFTCVCDTAMGWTNIQKGGKSQGCTPPVDLCRDDPCSTRQRSSNRCNTDLQQGTYTCTCDSEGGWATPRDLKSCLPPLPACPDPAIQDPCLTKFPENTCIDNKDGTYTCQCNQPGYTNGAQDRFLNVLSCIPPAIQCQSDELCFAYVKGGGNRCVDKGDGTYACICNTRNWQPGNFNVNGDAQTCIPPSRSCTDRRICSAGYQGNFCIDEDDGTYKCDCGAKGWRNGPDPANPSCEPIPQCNDPSVCSEAVDKNYCIDNNNGTYYCSCGASGWNPADPNRWGHPQACSQPGCRKCRTGIQGNTCNRLNDGTFECECRAKGWGTSADKGECTPPPRQCVSRAVCATSYRGNRCIDQQDGTYICVCGAPGWQATDDEQYCQPPINRCLDSNTCSQTVVGNKCTDHGDGTHSCTCKGAGWKVGPVRQTCVPPPAQCAHPSVCSTNVIGNICLDNRDGTYKCLCQAKGWTPGRSDAFGNVRECQAPPSRCTANSPCRTEFPGNACIDSGDGSYACVCNAEGWGIGAGIPPQFCKSLSNPCSSADRCQTSYQGNKCRDNLDGTYKCECGAPGFLSGSFALECVLSPPTPSISDQTLAERGGSSKDPCASPDPCGMYLKVGNTCTSRRDGSYSCRCEGGGWVEQQNPHRCAGPTPGCPALESDMCQAMQPGNACFTSEDGAYFCQCSGNYRRSTVRRFSYLQSIILSCSYTCRGLSNYHRHFIARSSWTRLFSNRLTRRMLLL